MEIAVTSAWIPENNVAKDGEWDITDHFRKTVHQYITGFEMNASKALAVSNDVHSRLEVVGEGLHAMSKTTSNYSFGSDAFKQLLKTHGRIPKSSPNVESSPNMERTDEHVQSQSSSSPMVWKF